MRAQKIFCHESNTMGVQGSRTTQCFSAFKYKKNTQLISGRLSKHEILFREHKREYAVSSHLLTPYFRFQCSSIRNGNALRQHARFQLWFKEKSSSQALYNLSRFPPGSKVRCIYTIQKINGSCFHTTCSSEGPHICHQPHKHRHSTPKHRVLSLVRLVKTQNVPQPR